MSDYAISYADLSVIESGLRAINSNLGTLNNNIDVVNSNVDRVDDNVRVVYNEVGALAAEFRSFVQTWRFADNRTKAQQRLLEINQDLEKRFGHYDVVRRTTTGILQADDLGLVKKDTITTATEELMIATPGYWLTPCLVALAAWINDQPDLAEKALKEAIRRDDEKTSLFWALVCRRAERKGAALKWTQRYLQNQDEKNLDRKTVIILDAYASGLLGSDAEGVVSKQMGLWLERLAEEPGFVEQQTAQWSAAINLKRTPYKGTEYTYLPKFSKTWPVLQDIMEGAQLHGQILDYFTDIFDQEVSNESLKAQLDEILTNLVSGFDQEEAPLRKEKRYNQLIVEFEGDEDRARRHMAVEQSAYDEHKDFTQLLTDAAMKQDGANASVSTQKFAIALSKEWISTAYNDVVATNRAKIPYEIQVNVDDFNDKTTDGRNEQELVSKFTAMVDGQEAAALEQYKLSGFEKFCLWGGAAIGVVGLIFLLGKNFLFGIIAIIAGLGMIINHSSKKKAVAANRAAVSQQFAQKRDAGNQVIRALLAEVVDFRAAFAKVDSESQKVVDFLEQISPEQYVRKLADTGRRIRVSE